MADQGHRLVRVLDAAEACDSICCWWDRETGCCDLDPSYRVATPIGHLDYCDDHADGAVASLPVEWIEGWQHQPTVPDLGDDDGLPF